MNKTIDRLIKCMMCHFFKKSPHFMYVLYLNKKYFKVLLPAPHHFRMFSTKG